MPQLNEMPPFPELRDLADEIRRLFDDLEGAFPPAAAAGEVRPALDAYETDSAIEVTVDLPGVTAGAIRVLLKAGFLVVAGRKNPPDLAPETNDMNDMNDPNRVFHLVERGFGWFARAVRLSGAFDGRRARAVLRAGELKISVPKIDERRGREILVKIEEL